MSVRKERFCDFMVEEKADYFGKHPEPTTQCTTKAVGTCFFCKRDYCGEHGNPSAHVHFELTGFKQPLIHCLPTCKNCQGDLPYNPSVLVLKHFERCWRAIKRDIRAEIKTKKLAAKAAREKREAKKAAAHTEA